MHARFGLRDPVDFLAVTATVPPNGSDAAHGPPKILFGACSRPLEKHTRKMLGNTRLVKQTEAIEERKSSGQAGLSGTAQLRPQKGNQLGAPNGIQVGPSKGPIVVLCWLPAPS